MWNRGDEGWESLRGSAESADKAAQRRAKEPLIADTLTLLGVNRPGEPVGAHFDGEGLGPYDEDSERIGDFSLIFPAADAAHYDKCVAALWLPELE